MVKQGLQVGLVILALCLVVSIGFNIYLYNAPITSSVVLEEKALLDVQIYDWAINEDNTDEIFFDYWVYNYGNVEAKNIEVKCKLFDEKGYVRVSVLDYTGNLASK